jgi:predicted 3-demethylubiquinone-9 3-methyltransferase (glyoxalase superfamily)
MNQKIVPHLWFDKEAKEAAQFYVDVLGEDSKVTGVQTLHDTPGGDTDVVSFELRGFSFMAISAGPLFKFNPSISFSVLYTTKEEVDALWGKLIEGGKALMEIGSYDWSDRYGWVQDKYGLTWQIMLAKEVTQKIVPHLTFTQKMVGKAEEAMQFYVSVFRNSKMGDIFRYPAGQEPDKEGTVMHGTFTLEGQQFSAMDSAREHAFTFNEAVSLMVNCKDQEEIDYYWAKLSAVPESEQCGWCKDKYGVSWQITPAILGELLSGSEEQRSRVTQAFLKMKKLVIEELRKGYEG